ncbi:MAG: hypothetical protein JXA96_01335 [Sedimentisphaerales bacterium]|nr:hypothetical protein [Sedimentisphaerales bacterium]
MGTKRSYLELNKSEHIKVLAEQLNTIRNRFYLLGRQDRMIMSMYLDKEMSFRQIALLFNTNPNRISRRIRKIIFELSNGKFIFCMKKRERFTRYEMDIAKDYFVRGLSIKQIAQKKNTSFYHIRELLKEVRHNINKIQKEKL